MQASYSILFDIQLMHEYFTDRKGRDLAIVPTADCLYFFKGAHILWRNAGNRYYALIRENRLHEPFINIPPENGSPAQKMYRQFFGKVVFRFYIRAKSPLFFNYSNMGASVPNHVFYFSNLAANQRSGTNYLSLPVSNHANSKEYLPGDMAALPGTDNVFEVIRKHSSANVSELNDASLWAPKGQLQYPTAQDLLEYAAGRYTFVLSAPATTANISFFSFNYDDNAPAYNIAAGTLDPLNFPAARSHIPVDMSALNPGKYMVTVNGESRLVYYDPFLAGGGVLGIMEIFNHLPGTNGYALLTDDENIRGASYVLQFATRRVLWKYIRKDSRAQAITDTGTTGYAFSLHEDEFVSATPIPLSEAVLETLELTFQAPDFKMQSLPNPSVQRLGRFNRNGYDYLCSEMFLNY